MNDLLLKSNTLAVDFTTHSLLQVRLFSNTMTIDGAGFSSDGNKRVSVKQQAKDT